VNGASVAALTLSIVALVLLVVQWYGRRREYNQFFDRITKWERDAHVNLVTKERLDYEVAAVVNGLTLHYESGHHTNDQGRFMDRLREAFDDVAWIKGQQSDNVSRNRNRDSLIESLDLQMQRALTQLHELQSQPQPAVHEPRELDLQERQELAAVWGFMLCLHCGTLHSGQCPRVKRIRERVTPTERFIDTWYWADGEWEPHPDAYTSSEVFGSPAAAAIEANKRMQEAADQAATDQAKAVANLDKEMQESADRLIRVKPGQ
jgi:hypothetical protein